MRLTEIFKRQGATDNAFEKLESSLSEMLLVEMAPPLQPNHVEAEEADAAIAEAIEVSAEEPAGETDGEGTAEAQEEEAEQEAPRTTAYAQARLAEFAAFESLQHDSQAELELMSGALAKIKSAQHQTREFLNSVHSGIHRTNELEMSVAKLTSENRLLYRQAEHVNRLRSRHEALVGAYKNREAKLLDNAEGLRSALAAAKLEVVEAKGAIAALEAERRETMNALAAATSHAERTARENEVLREKHINLSADLEAVSRKRTEAERRVDEFAAMHTRDTAEIAELRAKLGSADAERQRLQKQNDALQARLTEMNETLVTLEREMEEQAQRHDLGLQGLRGERDTLAARLEVLSRAELEANARIGELTDGLNDATAERRILEERVASLLRERDEALATRRDTAALEQENKRLEATVKALSVSEPALPPERARTPDAAGTLNNVVTVQDRLPRSA
ncbi:MAG TPA: hypothetical protein VGN97_01645 [Mesorhizobium sp.]|jgi:chromosome segregation ATPase|nr:hypothetical protein [Mesorhizobium sp.]